MMDTRFLSKQQREELEALDRATKRITRNKKSAIAFLKQVGILNKKGKLAKPYRTPKE